MDFDDFADAASPSIPGRALNRNPNPDYDEEHPTSAMRKWTDFGGDSIGCPATHDRLVPGMYTQVPHHDGRIIFKRMPINVDDLIRFSDSVCDTVMQEVEQFWQRGAAFKQFKYLHRRGYLFYGPAGSGKSSVVQQIIQDIIDRDGVVMLCSVPDILNKALQTFRQIEPDRPVVCVFEDIDAIISQHGEDAVLSLLDGENQIDKVLNIATTNYPERLDRRVVARPRRFDRVVKVGMPGRDMRNQYFQRKLIGASSGEIAEWTDMTDKLSMASLAELVISVKCLGNPLDTTIETLRKMATTKRRSSDDDGGPVGFRKDDDDD